LRLTLRGWVQETAAGPARRDGGLLRDNDSDLPTCIVFRQTALYGGRNRLQNVV
jgi:hypothetical protein